MKSLLTIAPALLLYAASLTGCHRKVVATNPVPPQQMAVEISPSKHHVWVPGSYSYRKGKYHWRNGRFKDRSATKPVLIAGHWKQGTDGLVWVKPRWKKF